MYFLFFLISTVSLSCASSHHGKHHRFDNPEKWEKVFENNERVQWQKPLEVINELGIKSDSIVADIGSATGFFSVRIAKKVKKGRVWAIDVEPRLVNYLNDRGIKEKINNLFSVLGTFDDPLIPEKVDFIFIVNTYHHLSNREKYFSRLKKRMNKDAQIVIIDFKKKKLPFGPKVNMKISKNQIITELQQAGFILFKSSNILEYQNLLIFKTKS